MKKLTGYDFLIEKIKIGHYVTRDNVFMGKITKISDYSFHYELNRLSHEIYFNSAIFGLKSVNCPEYLK